MPNNENNRPMRPTPAAQSELNDEELDQVASGGIKVPQSSAVNPATNIALCHAIIAIAPEP